jgi:outer membrane biosynthesis protein TonB
MGLLRFLKGATSQPRRFLDEDGQSPAAALLRAARMNGPPPPEGAKERAMAALDRAVAETSEPAQEPPPRAEVAPARQWARIVPGVAIAAAAAMVPLWMWLRPEQGVGPRTGVEPILVVRLDCGDARRLVRPVDIVYPRDAVAAGVEAELLVSCNVSEGGAFSGCRLLQAPANAKIDAAEVLRSVGTWRYPISESERSLLSSTCTVRIELQLQGP